LSSQIGGTSRGAQDFLNVTMQAVLGTDRILHQFRVAADHQQQVVKIVCNPARK